MIIMIITILILVITVIVIIIVILSNNNSSNSNSNHNNDNSSNDNHGRPASRNGGRAATISFHNFKSQNFKLSVSNPRSKYVAYVSVLSQISNCQGLGRKNKHEIMKTDRSYPREAP